MILIIFICYGFGWGVVHFLNEADPSIIPSIGKFLGTNIPEISAIVIVGFIGFLILGSIGSEYRD